MKRVYLIINASTGENTGKVYTSLDLVKQLCEEFNSILDTSFAKFTYITLEVDETKTSKELREELN